MFVSILELLNEISVPIVIVIFQIKTGVFISEALLKYLSIILKYTGT